MVKPAAILERLLAATAVLSRSQEGGQAGAEANMAVNDTTTVMIAWVRDPPPYSAAGAPSAEVAAVVSDVREFVAEKTEGQTRLTDEDFKHLVYIQAMHVREIPRYIAPDVVVFAESQPIVESAETDREVSIAD